MTAIRFALSLKFEASVVAILVAAVFDGLDGRIARLLKSTSEFGAQLDSLSDFISFGVAPAMLIYLWTLQTLGGVGWAVALLFAVCCALRLARFNAELGLDKPTPYAHSFFKGVPAPAAAGLVLLPVMMSFELGTALRTPLLNLAVVIAIAALMVSRVPTFSFKRFRLKPDHVLPVLLIVGLLAAFLTTAPWPTLSIVGLTYLASIPLSMRSMARLKAAVRASSVDSGETPAA